ncbi:MAG: HD domain-containing protein [Cyclobacteriaceae bacterium]|nr:HD domain-containing protein [Cyclobacteriaceae bacterium]
MTHTKLVSITTTFVKETLKDAEGGHDWWHIYRVWKSALSINKVEMANDLVVQLGALLHDIADSKFHNGDEIIGPTLARKFLENQKIEESIIVQVIDIIENISFKGGFNEGKKKSLELQVVQDADRLDAIGAIGIARAFNYGGFKNRVIHNPSIKPATYNNKETYKKNTAPTINHFYEKLLLLKDQMNTDAGKKMASQRHQFMELYLKQFYLELEGGY